MPDNPTEEERVARIKELQNLTGEGLMTCKLTLIESKWDVKEAIRKLFRERHKPAW